jgi:hypothetical protein
MTKPKTLWSASELRAVLTDFSALNGRLIRRYGFRKRKANLRLTQGTDGKWCHREAIYCNDPTFNIDGPAAEIRYLWLLQRVEMDCHRLDNKAIVKKIKRVIDLCRSR